MSVLRPGLLEGRAVSLVGTQGAVAAALERLGASPNGTDPDALVFDAATAFGGGDGAGLMAMLESVWAAVLALVPDLIAAQRPGKVVLIAPAPRSGALAGAAADALENLARTLSIEWARHAITTCAIACSDTTTPEELAELVAYLLSPAGDYVTGTRLELTSQAPWAGSSAQGTMTASS